MTRTEDGIWAAVVVRLIAYAVVAGLLLALLAIVSGCEYVEPAARYELWKRQMASAVQTPGLYAIPDADPAVLDPWLLEVAEDEDGSIWTRFKNIPLLDGRR